jgi:hypothetical protein
MSFPRINISEAPSGGTSVNTLPNAGQKVMAESLSVAVASDQILSVAGVVQVGNWPISGLSVSFPSAQHVIIDSMPAGGAATDVTDRSARLLGHVTVDNASLAVTGSFWQATQPVSGSFWQATQPVSLATNTPDVTDRSARLLGHVTVDNASLAVTGTFWQATQPVSGTVTANAGTNLNTSALALDATLTGGTQQAKITDGTNVATVKAASTLPAATDRAVVVTARDSIAVTGTFWQATQPVSGTFWQATQPVSGTVTANAGTNLNTSALALDATLTGGTQRTKITDGTNNAAVKAASTAAVAADPAQVVAISPNNTVGVTGTFWQATQPVSGTFWQATQPISAASLPLPTGAALDATLTGGTQQARITDGTNVATVKAASTAAVAADKAVVVAQSPNTYATTVARLVSAAATTNATLVKNSAGRVFKVRGYNAKAAVCYLKLYNKATAPAPASDSALIIMSIALKASDVFDIDLGVLGLAFSTGIGYALTGASSDTDATALVAADIVGLNILYA